MTFDIAIIGGGVNGCGIAREASLRGASVFLCEMNDLASATSSASTKLIHGGLRYLEYYEFRLVREALAEREVLWAMAPHIIRPLRFVLPYHKGLRPAWYLRLGLFLYDHLGGRRELPGTTRVDLEGSPIGAPLKRGESSFGFEYSDCWVDDARLVALNAVHAAELGAVVKTRTRALGAERAGDAWSMTLEDAATGERSQIRAKVLVNAAGPWVSEVLDWLPAHREKAHVRLVQGSHIVVPKLYDHDRCFIFQNADNRIIFSLPYERDYTLIGTTDLDYSGNPGDVKASAKEIDYLCSAASEYFAAPVEREHVVWSYSGVRPLYDDGASVAQAATRDYLLELDVADDLPLLSVFGGKITTYRRLALHALEKLSAHLPGSFERDWKRIEPLPGGDFPMKGFAQLADKLRRDYPWLDAGHAERLARSYGTRASEILGAARSAADLGHSFGATLYAAEVDYLMRAEWARTAADLAWRRSKLGLRMSEAEMAALDRYMNRTSDVRIARGQTVDP